ncbi:MAG: peptidylprolyl isomerase [Lachnospiraceae bacterium]|nr:peptidylprolyl isomerase [Lachnospiraceae bacterium]
MRRKKKNIVPLLLLAVILLVIGVVVGVKVWNGEGEEAKVIFTTGFEENELFRIGDLSCTKSEFMVYLTNTQNQYENVYGSEIWNVTHNDMTLEENIMETVLAKIAQIKSMYLLAEEKDVVLSEEEKLLLEQAAEAYYSSLTEKEVQAMGITKATVLGLYQEYACAEKVYQQIIGGVNPEISDDEARTITVEHILIKTYTTDGTGQRIAFSEERKQRAYVTAQEILALATDGENDFALLAAEYSEDATVRYSFGKGEVDAVFEAAAFNLATDEISGIVETESGYEIIKCISTFDREETDANKIKIVEKRKNEAFGAEYDAFVGRLARRLNEKLWSNISMIEDEEVKTDDFFAVYHEYFDEK